MPTYIVYYSQGNSNGPFSIYLSGSSGLNLYASPVTRAQLELGYTVTFPDGIPSSSVDVFDISYGCFTDQNIPFPSVSPSVTPSITITPSKTPSITVSPSKTPTPTQTPSVTPSITPPPSVTPTQTPSATPSRTPAASVTPSPSITPTLSITRTPSPSPPTVYTYSPTTQQGWTQNYVPCNNIFNVTLNSTAMNTSAPNVGTIIYSVNLNANPPLYTPINGNNLWWGIAWSNNPTLIRSVQINTSGVITATYTCP